MRIKAKYASSCRECGNHIQQGDQVEWERGIRGVLCLECSIGSGPEVQCGDEPDFCDCGHQLRRGSCSHCNSEYAMGVADANRYLTNRAIYGEELADQWEIEDEIRRGGEW
jgi:hypothetical protein